MDSIERAKSVFYYPFLDRFTQGQANVTVVMDVPAEDPAQPGTMKMWNTVILELGRGDGSYLRVWSDDWSKRLEIPTERAPLVVRMESYEGVRAGSRALCSIGGLPGQGKPVVVKEIYGNPVRTVFKVQDGDDEALYSHCYAPGRQ